MNKQLFIIAIILLGSCSKAQKQPQYTCSEPTVQIPAQLLFSGFIRSDLDTIYLTNYTPDSTFSKILSTDTLIAPVVGVSNGYLSPYYDSSVHTINVDDTRDLKIELPSAKSIFRLHAVYAAPYVVTWQQNEPGCRARGFTQSPDVTANGIAPSRSDNYFILTK